MCSNCDTSQEPIINRLQFEKWATKLYPLATKQNYQRYVCSTIYIFSIFLCVYPRTVPLTHYTDHGNFAGFKPFLHQINRVFLALASDGTNNKQPEENESNSDNDDGSRKGSFGRLRQRMTGCTTCKKAPSNSS